MSTQCRGIALSVMVALAVAGALQSPARASDQPITLSEPVQPNSSQRLWVRAQAGQRLSESWLQARPATAAQTPAADNQTVPGSLLNGSSEQPLAAPYTLGLMWIAPAARAQQRRELRSLLAQLSRAAAKDTASAAWAAPLRQELASMPVTGRVPLPAHDMQWLQANPAYDPLLSEGDEWWLPATPDIVRVWVSSGERCDLPFSPDTPAARYVARCAGGGAAELADTVQLVQPDGRVQAVGIAAWNAQLQAAPAPGAWIWAPRRDANVAAEVHATLAQWLATQGPAGAEPVPSAERLGGEVSLLATAESTGVSNLRDLPRNASDWGITGLLQTPTARTRDAGAFGLTVSRTWPYTQINLLLSPFERLEVAVRYTNVSTVLYGPAIAGDQSYKDKSAELKLRLLDEGSWTPAVAVGLRDPGGTGFFAGEYVVASKRWGDWDLSLGLGWGYLGQRGDLPNPLAGFGNRFKTRQVSTNASGGTANIGALFTGRTALFGGVQWHSPWDGLVLKLELDGNDYQQEPGGKAYKASLPINAGVSWRWGDAELGLAWQRGNQWSMSLAWVGSLPKLGMPKSSLSRLPPVEEPVAAPAAVSMAVAPAPTPVTPNLSAADPVLPGAGVPSTATTASATASASASASAASAPASALPGNHATAGPAPAAVQTLLNELGHHSGWHATSLERGPNAWTAYFDHAGGAYVRERLERIWAVLHREAPPEVTSFAIELASRQMPMARHEVDRHAWAAARSRYLAKHQQPADTPADGVKPVSEPQTQAALTPSPAGTPRLATGFNLGYQQHLGGPDGYLYALSARAFGQVRAWQGAWLQGNLQVRLLDNYAGFNYTAPSELPRVRTHMREYVTTRRVTMPNLQFTQTGRLTEGLYGMVYGGYLEPMFAGVGAELLWRPLNSRWAVGLDLNLVRKRDFEQDFGLQDYQAKTGHLTVRWDTGWQDVVAGVSAGQYLAGDRGVTVDLARVFANGTRMGVWATRTNVSAAQFGEGSFDKGLYFTVPFDAMFTSWSGSAMTVAWQPLVRDGGAKLQKGASLWGLTDVRDSRIMDFRPAPTDVPLN